MMEEIMLSQETPAEEEASPENIGEAENEPTERERLLEEKLFCIQSGVPEESCEVVIAAASAMNSADRKAAITELLERYPFFKPMQERSSVTTGVHLEGIETAPVSGVEEAFFAANPDCR